MVINVPRPTDPLQPASLKFSGAEEQARRTQGTNGQLLKATRSYRMQIYCCFSCGDCLLGCVKRGLETETLLIQFYFLNAFLHNTSFVATPSGLHTVVHSITQVAVFVLFSFFVGYCVGAICLFEISLHISEHVFSSWKLSLPRSKSLVCWSGSRTLLSSFWFFVVVFFDVAENILKVFLGVCAAKD